MMVKASGHTATTGMLATGEVLVGSKQQCEPNVLLAHSTVTG
jgi:hypothetical protein